MSVGSNIKKRRYELKMSQQELADRMGYRTRSTIAKIESGENDVSQKKLLRFAAVLDTTVEALVAGSSVVNSEAAPFLQGGRKDRTAVIILAGGKSGRNRQNIPSQFISIHGKPILVYSMEAYQAHPLVDDIYAVCLKGWETIVSAYAAQYGITKLRGLIPAGNSGMASLKNAVDAIREQYSSQAVILVQEATRPLVGQETISRVLHACAEKGSATSCHPMRDYVQFEVIGGKAKYVDRDAIIALQSPEAHRFSLLLELFEKAERRQKPLVESCCTMLLHNLGYEINFVESSINNIKIDREEDFATFSALVKEKA